jgi:hypothetical protein
MALAAWPEAVPFRPRRRAWTETPQENRVEFGVEVGIPKSRPRGTSAGFEVKLQIPMTRGELDAFWAFWRDDIAQGNEPFTAADPVSGADHVWKFLARPSAAPEAARWALTADLIRMA